MHALKGAGDVAETIELGSEFTAQTTRFEKKPLRMFNLCWGVDFQIAGAVGWTPLNKRTIFVHGRSCTNNRLRVRSSWQRLANSWDDDLCTLCLCEKNDQMSSMQSIAYLPWRDGSNFNRWFASAATHIHGTAMTMRPHILLVESIITENSPWWNKKIKSVTRKPYKRVHRTAYVFTVTQIVKKRLWSEVMTTKMPPQPFEYE